MKKIRLQKIIALAGLASRREAERMIAQGRVSVDGKIVTQLGTCVDPKTASIRLDNKPIPHKSKNTYIMLNKPRSVLSAMTDDRGRKTIVDLLDDSISNRGPNRVFHVGRLDYNTEGLLLLTNDGELAQNLTHPSRQVPRTYQARIRGNITTQQLSRLVSGLALEDGIAYALQANILKRNPRSVWIEITVAEGRNRLVRRMVSALGYQLQRLIRVEFGGLQLGALKLGHYRFLTDEEVRTLKRWETARRRTKKQQTQQIPRPK